MDFERAAIKSFQKYFPNATIKGCLFHFGQALHKKLKKLQLSELYQNNQEFKGWIRLIFALALIPLASVMKGWQKVLERKLKFGCSEDVKVDSNQAVTSQPTSTTELVTTTAIRPTRGRCSRGPRVARVNGNAGRKSVTPAPQTGTIITIGRGGGRGKGRSRGRGRGTGRGSSLMRSQPSEATPIPTSTSSQSSHKI